MHVHQWWNVIDRKSSEGSVENDECVNAPEHGIIEKELGNYCQVEINKEVRDLHVVDEDDGCEEARIDEYRSNVHDSYSNKYMDDVP